MSMTSRNINRFSKFLLLDTAQNLLQNDHYASHLRDVATLYTPWNCNVSNIATSLRLGGICTDNFVANFILSLVVKEFKQSINISRSYRHE